MDKTTEDLLLQKFSSKIDFAKLGRLSGDDVKQKLEEAIDELTSETKVAKQISYKNVEQTTQKLDAFELFWYAVAASFLVNLLSNALWELVMNFLIPKDLLSQLISVCITITLSSILLLTLVYLLIAKIMEAWVKSNREHPVLRKIYDDVQEEKAKL